MANENEPVTQDEINKLTNPLSGVEFNEPSSTNETPPENSTPGDSYKLSEKKKSLLLTELRARGLAVRDANTCLLNIVKVVETNIE